MWKSPVGGGGASLTTSAAVPLTPLGAVALTTVEPGFRPVTRPSALTEAVPEFSTVQVNVANGRAAPLASKAVAVKDTEAPTTIVLLAGATVTVATSGSG